MKRTASTPRNHSSRHGDPSTSSRIPDLRIKQVKTRHKHRVKQVKTWHKHRVSTAARVRKDNRRHEAVLQAPSTPYPALDPALFPAAHLRVLPACTRPHTHIHTCSIARARSRSSSALTPPSPLHTHARARARTHTHTRQRTRAAFHLSSLRCMCFRLWRSCRPRARAAYLGTTPR